MLQSWRRLYSTALKATPSKIHLHKPIPSDNFPKGFRLTGLHCGVKKSPSALDLAVIVSDAPSDRTSAAACFTENAFRAAPVLVSEEILAGNKRARALVVNSGCANAVTGQKGLDHAWAMSSAVDALLDPPAEKQTMVMSTGVIGQHLPIDKILSGIKTGATDLGDNFEAWERAAKAFMTTDTFPKLRARTFDLDGKKVRIAGMDKGAGMIHPRMGPPKSSLHATLLGFVATDALISPPALQSALTHAVQRSFNSISVDGDMSTNDTIIVIANGASGMTEPIEDGTPAFSKFQDELTDFCAEIAKLIVRDGEGARKFVTVSVEGASTYEDASKVASTISTSMLVKTALYGEDANWGRILASAGSVSDSLSKPLDPSRVSVSFIPAATLSDTTPLKLLTRGEPETVDEERAKVILSEEDLEIKVELGIGNESAVYWTCDLSHEYVSINGDYRS
ncbi:arginine biosynthesis protein ArgJ [Sistotremastrum suecicum HHB10207 ss-3]|uniref:Arginine biosynthesis bifunctional protein ArgJ, mitochondrial n=1 Tax=Sistotremastrum suecicum HHB10207 ss-3 TaxID=1314776 RepID=A0A166HYH8_9AGAM|nr:arginine biosynthesis protein ArgJ [Sistotremastrum suecicum HHB10207 ss-3]